jgi:hypothetical protein
MSCGRAKGGGIGALADTDWVELYAMRKNLHQDRSQTDPLFDLNLQHHTNSVGAGQSVAAAKA